MPHPVSQIRVLHVWDYRVDSGANIDDQLVKTDLNQLSVSRVLTQDGTNGTLSQRSLLTIEKMISPYPSNILMRQLSKMKFARFLKSEIRIFKPDVIFFHFGQTAASLIEPLEEFKIPYIVAFYGHDISVALRQQRWQAKYKIFSKSDAKFLVLSAGVKKRVANLGIHPEQIVAYNYPIQLTPYLKVHKVQDARNFTITIPGRLVEKKGHFILFQALRLLNEQGIRPKLKVLGYGNDWVRFKEQASAEGIGNQVDWIDTSRQTIHGGFDALYCEELAKTDLVVLPCVTSSEGDDEAGPALVLCLAQASGTPVLTTPFEGHEVSITNGQTGILTTEADPRDLADKIAWCMNHPAEVQRIAQSGKEHVQEVFDRETNLRIIYEAISDQAQKSPWKI